MWLATRVERSLLSPDFNMRRISLCGSWAILSFLSACSSSSNDESPERAAATGQAIGNIEGTFEYALDAPWRIEPNRTNSGQLEYGAIPLQLSIHDTDIIGS